MQSVINLYVSERTTLGRGLSSEKHVAVSWWRAFESKILLFASLKKIMKKILHRAELFIFFYETVIHISKLNLDSQPQLYSDLDRGQLPCIH